MINTHFYVLIVRGTPWEPGKDPWVAWAPHKNGGQYHRCSRVSPGWPPVAAMAF